MFWALGDEFVFNILNYIGFIFIPIVAAAHHLTLSQIAIVFAIMRLPYVINFFTGEIADRYNKSKLIIIVFFFLSFLFAGLATRDGFTNIVIMSFGIAFALSIIRPVIAGLISDHTLSQDTGKITGIQQFVA